MILSRTPLRISFAGGGTDLPAWYNTEGGMVVSATIEKYVYVILNKHFEGGYRLSYSKTENVDKLDDLQHDLVRETLRAMDAYEGMEIVTIADVPGRGTGLGSSSSLCVGLVNALDRLRFPDTRRVEPRFLAERAFFIENAKCGKTLGKQDQYAAACGGINTFMFSEEKVDIASVFPAALYQKLNATLVLVYTGETRSAEDILAVQGQQTVASQATRFALKSVMELARDLDIEFRKGDVSHLGEILHAGWIHKKEFAPNISDLDIDYLYNKGLQSGADGGKLLGAGGGGFLLFVVPPNNRARFEDGMSDYKKFDAKITTQGSSIIQET